MAIEVVPHGSVYTKGGIMHRKRKFRIGSLLCVVIFMALSGCQLHHPARHANLVEVDRPNLADQRNLFDDVRFPQDKINGGTVSFADLFLAGKHIFSNRFTTEDHFGEGAEGPRRSKYAINDRPDYPFLRFNGLDSQSCLECHLAIGFTSGDKSIEDHQFRFVKEPGLTAGGAGFASNAFNFNNFACKPGVNECDPDHATTGFVRNPPHAFGAGYLQQLAEEMTWALQEIREKAAQENPGVPVPLVAKGVSFGEIAVNADGSIDTAKSSIVGINEDLIVRPFQWRGLTSNLRNFITGAMNFHFSIQPTELMTAGAIVDDLDEEVNEIHEGEITAVATFLAFLRPPIESAKGLNSNMVNRGREVFGEAKCITCHRPTLEMESPYVTIRDPRTDQELQAALVDKLGFALPPTSTRKQKEPTLTVPYGTMAPVLEKYIVKKQAKAKLRQLSLSVDPEKLDTMMAEEMNNRLKGFTHTLNDESGPSDTLPRLSTNSNGRVAVPLYSDLKRHVMGDNLAESFPQQTDGGQDHQVPGNQFLTRPLWGVADTGPWMHDGRALTLTEAIVMHEGPGSEANASVEKFKALSDNDRLALRSFLSSLRLPLSKP